MRSPENRTRKNNLVDRQQVLIEEYKLCAARADHLTTLIWTLGTGLVALNAAGIVFLGQHESQPSSKTEGYYWLAAFFSFAAIYLLMLWYRAANRWNAIIHVRYLRMTEIEEDIKTISKVEMWAERDVGIVTAFFKRTTERLHPDMKSRLDELRTRLPKELSSESIQQLRLKLVGATALAWILMLVREAHITVTAGGTSVCSIFAVDHPLLCTPITLSAPFVIFILIVVPFELIFTLFQKD